MIVMLIWMSVMGDLRTGAAATIQGFATVESCERAIPKVKDFYDGIFHKATVKCIDLAP